jgi:hypothetical protein
MIRIKRYTSILLNLTDDLLKEEFKGSGIPTLGHCYIASEAYYHLWGKDEGFFPVRAKDEEGITHWWLENNEGEIIDLTYTQYLARGIKPPYDKGKRGGFLTKEPSKRSKILMEKIEVSYED